MDLLDMIAELQMPQATESDRMLGGMVKAAGSKAIDTGREMFAQQSPIGKAALATAPIPGVGDIIGLLADADMFLRKPESRTAGNFSLAALGALPFLPAATVAKAPTFIVAIKHKKTGNIVSGAPMHGVLYDQIEKRGEKIKDYISGFTDETGKFMTREESYKRLESFSDDLARVYNEKRAQNIGELEETFGPGVRAPLERGKLEAITLFDTLEEMKR